MRCGSKETAYYIIREKIKSNDIMCLKDSSNRLLGVALSEAGLRGIANKAGRYVYSGATNLENAYKQRKLPWLKVEKFIPNEKPDKYESLWLDKAYRLCNMV